MNLHIQRVSVAITLLCMPAGRMLPFILYELYEYPHRHPSHPIITCVCCMHECGKQNDDKTHQQLLHKHTRTEKKIKNNKIKPNWTICVWVFFLPACIYIECNVSACVCVRMSRLFSISTSTKQQHSKSI